MSEPRMKNGYWEAAFRWLCRSLASVGFIVTLIVLVQGVTVPAFWPILLLGLFFGPEVVQGQIQINRRRRNGGE